MFLGDVIPSLVLYNCSSPSSPLTQTLTQGKSSVLRTPNSQAFQSADWVLPSPVFLSSHLLSSSSSIHFPWHSFHLLVQGIELCSCQRAGIFDQGRVLEAEFPRSTEQCSNYPSHDPLCVCNYNSPQLQQSPSTAWVGPCCVWQRKLSWWQPFLSSTLRSEHMGESGFSLLLP